MDVFFLALTCLMALVMYFDASKFIIPNWLVGMVIAMWPAMLLVNQPSFEWYYSIGVMVAMFGAGYIIFILRVMGGGDIKLLTALSLWTGWQILPEFLVIMALLGGALAVFLLITRNAISRYAPVVAAGEKLPRIFRNKEPVPYGLAISVAFLIMLWTGRVPGLPL